MGRLALAYCVDEGNADHYQDSLIWLFSAEEDQTYMYRVAFEYLLERSLDSDQSRSRISTITRDVWA
jgi:hypothetical protein